MFGDKTLQAALEWPVAIGESFGTYAALTLDFSQNTLCRVHA
jgi:hypothetical protein